MQPITIPKDIVSLFQAVSSHMCLVIHNVPVEKLHPVSAPCIPGEDSLRGCVGEGHHQHAGCGILEPSCTGH